MESKDMKCDEKLKKAILPNGFTYYIYDTAANKCEVRISLVVKVGSLMESENEIGISHFTEHFCIYNNIKYFQSCNNETSKGVDAFCGYTKFMETVYYKKCSTRNLIDNLLGLKDILVGRNFHKSSIEKVRSELVNEIMAVTNKSNYKLKEIILPQIFDIKNVNFRMPIGKLDNINKFSYNSIVKFRNKWYKPENSCILIVGDIGKYDLRKFMQENFSQIKDHEKLPVFQFHNDVSRLKKKNFLINIFNDLKENEIQFYYSKTSLKYRSKLELEKKVTEYFQLSFVKEHICREFRYKCLDCNSIDFVPQRLINGFSYNVLQVRTDSNLNEKLEFIIKIIRKLVLIDIEEEQFSLYKKVFLRDLNNQYNDLKTPSIKLMMQECIDNYLYNEPVMSLKQEYELCNYIIKKMELNEFNIEIKDMLKKNVLISVNCKSDPHIDINKINKLIDFI